MKITIGKCGENLILPLADAAVAKLGWTRGDVLAVEVINDELRVERVQTFHDRAMEIARRGMVKYRKVFEALAKT